MTPEQRALSPAMSLWLADRATLAELHAMTIDDVHTATDYLEAFLDAEESS